MGNSASANHRKNTSIGLYSNTSSNNIMSCGSFLAEVLSKGSFDMGSFDGLCDRRVLCRNGDDDRAPRRHHRHHEGVATVVHVLEGRLLEYDRPVKAIHVLLHHPRHCIFPAQAALLLLLASNQTSINHAGDGGRECHPDMFDLERNPNHPNRVNRAGTAAAAPPADLLPDDYLQLGRLYLLLPFEMLHRLFQPQLAAAAATKVPSAAPATTAIRADATITNTKGSATSHRRTVVSRSLSSPLRDLRQDQYMTTPGSGCSSYLLLHGRSGTNSDDADSDSDHHTSPDHPYRRPLGIHKSISLLRKCKSWSMPCLFLPIKKPT